MYILVVASYRSRQFYFLDSKIRKAARISVTSNTDSTSTRPIRRRIPKWALESAAVSASGDYDTRMNDLFNNGWIGSLPFVESYSVSNPTASDATATFSNPYGKATNPFPAPTPLPSTVTFTSPFSAITFDPSGNFKVPLMYNWNLALEQQVTTSMSTRLAYVASHGSGIPLDTEQI